MKHYLLLDLGTGNSRAALVRADGKLLAVRGFSNRYYRDEAYPDAQYFLPEEWAGQLLDCCRQLHEAHPEVRVEALSCAAARQSIVLLDREGRAFLGLPNIDNRGREFMHELGEAPWIYERSGKWLTEDFCAGKLLGLRKRRPELYGRIAALLSLSGFVAWLFTGEAAFEPSQACETQLYDLEDKAWSPALCEAYGIDPALLPPLRNAGEVLGPVLPQLRRELGMAEGACFVVGGADAQAALLHAGMQSGDLAVISGTTTPVMALADHKLCDAQQRVWVDANLGAQGYLIETNPGVTGLNYQRAKALLAPELDYETLERAYERKRGFLCTACFSSLLFHERSSMQAGGFSLRPPFPADLDRTEFLWAVLADIACAAYEQLYRLRELCGHDRDFLLGCGGGFRSGALCRMLAELSGLELRLPPGFEQATLLGLAALCSRALGTEPPALEGETLRYLPGESPLIRDYRRKWLQDWTALKTVK